jgi:hypothetical protein
MEDISGSGSVYCVSPGNLNAVGGCTRKVLNRVCAFGDRDSGHPGRAQILNCLIFTGAARRPKVGRADRGIDERQ